MSSTLQHARRRLTASFVGVVAIVLLAFGVSTLVVVRREVAAHLDRTLEADLDAIVRASAIRERESASDAVDAFDELVVPGRDLYVFDASGSLVHPQFAPSWVQEVADAAAAGGTIPRLHEGSSRDWRIRARRFRVPGTRKSMVGVAVAGNVVAERFPELLLSFVVAGILALLLAAAGGRWLARRATAPAEATFEHMRRFTADAAHELRTPLSVVRSRGEVALFRDREPEDYRDALRDIVREAERLGGVVEKLLILARADTGEFVLARERQYLDDIVEDAMTSLQPLARERGLTLELEAPEEIQVAGDAGLLQHLVLILVDNALQYGESGGSVRLSVERADGRARLLVRDDGPGIDPALLPFVFERFFRGDPLRGRQAGAGLGLSIARWIAQVHGGTIALRANAGRGAVAEVLLPLA